MLLPHNLTVYAEFEEMLQKYNECILITATGTGKSYITEEYLTQNDYRALVISPKLAISDSWNKLTDRVETITYQAFYRHYNDIDGYDCYIFDEAHHIGGEVWGSAYVDFRKRITKPVIGLTAESRRFTDGGRDVAELYFNKHAVYGYSQQDAVEKGILPAATYVMALFDAHSLYSTYEEYRTKITEKLWGRLSKTLRNYMKIDEILKKHMPHNTRKGIVFVDSIERTQFAQSLIEQTFPSEDVYVIHSKMRRKTVSHVLQKFREIKHGYLIAVDMLNEGLHIGGVNTLIMLRKTASPMVYMQQLGRALTPNTKDVVVFDFVGNHNSLKIVDRDTYNTGTVRKSRGHRINRTNSMISSQSIVHDYVSAVSEILEKIDRDIKINLNTRTNVPWTIHEDTVLRRWYPIIGREIHTMLPGRTENACATRASQNQIRHDRKHDFTKNEAFTVKCAYDHMSFDEITLLLPKRTDDEIKLIIKYLELE